jgi:hypothetical protein
MNEQRDADRERIMQLEQSQKSMQEMFEKFMSSQQSIGGGQSGLGGAGGGQSGWGSAGGGQSGWGAPVVGSVTPRVFYSEIIVFWICFDEFIRENPSFV